MSNEQLPSWVNGSIEEAAEMLAKCACDGRQRRSHQKQAEGTPWLDALKLHAAQRPGLAATAAAGLGGAALGGTMGFLSGANRPKEERQPFRSALRGAIGGGALLGGGMLAASQFAPVQEQITQGVSKATGLPAAAIGSNLSDKVNVTGNYLDNGGILKRTYNKLWPWAVAGAGTADTVAHGAGLVSHLRGNINASGPVARKALERMLTDTAARATINDDTAAAIQQLVGRRDGTLEKTLAKINANGKPWRTVINSTDKSGKPISRTVQITKADIHNALGRGLDTTVRPGGSTIANAFRNLSNSAAGKTWGVSHALRGVGSVGRQASKLGPLLSRIPTAGSRAGLLLRAGGYLGLPIASHLLAPPGEPMTTEQTRLVRQLIEEARQANAGNG